VDAQFGFHVEGDRATSLTLFQNDRQSDGKRVTEALRVALRVCASPRAAHCPVKIR
jgi:hypothetical protein